MAKQISGRTLCALKTATGGGYLTNNQYVTNNTQTNNSFHKVTKAISLLSLLLLFLTSGNLFAQDVIKDFVGGYGGYEAGDKDGTNVNGVDYHLGLNKNPTYWYNYTVNPDCAYAYKWLGEADVDELTIKEKVTINGKEYPVVGIRGFFGDKAGCTFNGKQIGKIKTINVPSYIKFIGVGAFTRTNGLEGDARVFLGMKGLEHLNIEVCNNTENPGKLYETEIQHFLCRTSDDTGACQDLKTLVIKPVNEGDHAYLGCHSGNQEDAGNGFQFYGQSNLESVDMSVYGITYKAFYGCTNLKDISVRLKDGMKVADSAFLGCRNIENLTIIGPEPSDYYNPFSDYSDDHYWVKSSINWRVFDRGNHDSWVDPSKTNPNTKNTYAQDYDMTIKGKVKLVNCIVGDRAFRQVHFMDDVELSGCKVEGGAFAFATFATGKKLRITDKSFLRGNCLSRITVDTIEIDGGSKSKLGNMDSEGNIVNNTTLVNNTAKIKNIIIGDSCELDAYSFYFGSNEHNALLETIKIGNNCTIHEHVFKDKPNLHTIYIGEDCHLADGLFDNCPNLKNIYINSTTPPEFTGTTSKLLDDVIMHMIYFNETSGSLPTLVLDNGNAQYNPDFELTIHIPCPSDEAYKLNDPWKKLVDKNALIEELKKILKDDEEFSNPLTDGEKITASATDIANKAWSHEHIHYDNKLFKPEFVDHVVLKDCACLTPSGDYVTHDVFTIKNDGSLAFEDLSVALSHFTDGDNEVVLERDLSFNNWHLLGYMGNIADNTLTYADVLSTTQGHDFAALPFWKNDWQSDQKDKHKADKDGNEIYALGSEFLLANQSFMVWPFDKGWNDAENKPNDATISETATIKYQKKGTKLAEFSTTNSTAGVMGNFDFILTNNGSTGNTETNPTGANTGYWFPLYNPYIGRLDVKQVLQTNKTAIQGGYMYLFNPTAGDDESDWIAVNEDYAGAIKYLSPARGFMVAGKDDNKDLTFNLTYAMVDKNGGFADEEKPKTHNFKAGKQTNGMEFTIATDEARATATARYNAEASDGFDANDAYIMLSDGKDKLVEPYFVVDNRQIFDNHFSSLPYETEMRFHAAKQSHVDLTVSNIPASINVSVIDIATGEETQLTDGEKFSFVADEGENANRYKVKFYNSGVSIEDVNNTVADVRFTQNDKRVTIFGEGLQNVEVVNTLGQVVSSESVSGNEAQITINGNAGAYIVRVKTSNGTAIEKFIVK